MAVMEAPPQHMTALAKANRTRLARAALKREIAAGRVSVADVVRASPWEAETMTIFDLLMAQHRWGGTRIRRLLNRVPMSEAKTIGSMTDRQRRLLTGQLEGDDLEDAFPQPYRQRIPVMQRTCRICGATAGESCRVTRRGHPWSPLTVTDIPKQTVHHER